jgi:hypothetical protein
MMRSLPPGATIGRGTMTSAIARPAPPAIASSAFVIGRRRRIAIWALIVCASIIGFVGILTTWVERQMLDNKAWENASTQVIQSKDVRAALSTYLVNQLYGNVDVAGSLEQQLPANLKQLADPIASALRQPATATAAAILARPRVQALWINATTRAHEKLVNVLENKTGHGIDTGSGVVTVNLHTVVTELAAELGLPGKIVAQLPSDTGVITVMRSDQLSAAQTGVRAVHLLSAWLLVLVLAMFALAIYLARGARRTTLRNVGWAFIIVGLLVLVVRRWLGNYAITELTSPSYKGSVHDVWLIGTSILGQIATASILYGLFAVGAAVLAGPTRVAVASRRLIAPVLNHQPAMAAAAVAAVYLLLVLWGPTHALRKWWGILFFAALLAAGTYVLRRQTLAEFPDAGEPAPEMAPPPPAV